MNEDTYYPTEPQKLGEGYARARSAAATSGPPLDGPRCGRPRLVEARRDSDHAAMDPHYCPEPRGSCAGGDERRRHSRAFRTRCGSSGNTLKRSSDAPRGGRRHGRPQPRASFGLGCAHLAFAGRQDRHLGCPFAQPTGHAHGTVSRPDPGGSTVYRRTQWRLPMLRLGRVWRPFYAWSASRTRGNANGLHPPGLVCYIRERTAYSLGLLYPGI